MEKIEFSPEKHEKIEKILRRIAVVVGIVIVILGVLILIQFFLSVVFGYDILSRNPESSSHKALTEETDQISNEELYIHPKEATFEELANSSEMVPDELIIDSTTETPEIVSEYQFRCPEEYESTEELLMGYTQFLNYYQKKYPDLTIGELENIRHEELVSHNCEKTLANIANIAQGISSEEANLSSGDSLPQKYIIGPANSSINFMNELFGPYTREIDDSARIRTIHYLGSNGGSEYTRKSELKRENIFKISTSQQDRLIAVGLAKEDIDNIEGWFNEINPDTGMNYTVGEILAIPEVNLSVEEKEEILNIMATGGQLIMPEKITINFYLADTYNTESFSAKDIAESIIDDLGEETILENYFEAPDPIDGNPVFFIALNSVYPEERYGQASLIKVASMNDNVYSLSFSRNFITHHDISSLLSSEESYKEGDFLRDIITMWFIKNMEAYGSELSDISPSNDWVNYFQKEPIQYYDLTDKQLRNYSNFYKDPFALALREILDREKDIAELSVYSRGSTTLKSVVLTYDYYSSKFIVTAIKSLSDKEKEITIIFQDKPDNVFIAQIYNNRMSGYGGYYLRDFREYSFNTAKEKENFLNRYKNFITNKDNAL